MQLPGCFRGAAPRESWLKCASASSCWNGQESLLTPARILQQIR